VRLIEAFVDQCDLQEAGFRRVQPKDTGRPGYASPPFNGLPRACDRTSGDDAQPNQRRALNHERDAVQAFNRIV
jgi:hypothetical protein